MNEVVTALVEVWIEENEKDKVDLKKIIEQQKERGGEKRHQVYNK